MKELAFYQVDTFTNELFKGNPAGVCPLNEWIDEVTMQSIAFENNLSETAFYVKKGNVFEIRWFTPTTEVDLCGHATLASAFVEFNMHQNKNTNIIFKSKSGDLLVSNSKGLLTLDFPKDDFLKITLTTVLENLFEEKPTGAYKAGADVMLVFEDEVIIKNMIPSLEKIKRIEARGVTVTAKGKEVDFVSRFFGPQSGIEEDPVTGSTHTYLTAYWSTILNKDIMTASQLSERGGKLNCRLKGQRVEISGEAKLYLEGTILL